MTARVDKQRQPPPPMELAAATADAPEDSNRASRLALVLIIAFGLYQGLNYYGQQVIPNSDFLAFIRVGEHALDFEPPPYNYKRVPLWGIMYVAVGRLLGGPHPYLTAAWSLNVLLHTANAGLLYLLARRLFGRTAAWFAPLALLNPHALRWLVEPLAETCLLFFTLLTLYLIVRRTPWAYWAAMLMTMVRYEGAGLIAAAFVVDVCTAGSWRQRGRALAYAALASVPLILWLYGTRLQWSGGGTHYLESFGAEHFTWTNNLRTLWEVALAPLLHGNNLVTTEQGTMVVPNRAVETATWVLPLAGYAAAVYWGVRRRNWGILALALYLALYWLVHEMRPETLQRYYVPIAFAPLLLTWYAGVCGWRALDRWRNRPRWLQPAIVIVAVGVALPWIGRQIDMYQRFSRMVLTSEVIGEVRAGEIAPVQSAVDRAVEQRVADVGPWRMAALGPQSPRSAWLPYLAVSLGIVWTVATGLRQRQWPWRQAGLTVVVALLVVCNQMTLAGVVGSGKQDIEFKRLLDWYLDHSQPGEKLVVTLNHAFEIYAPDRLGDVVRVEEVQGETILDFAADCRRREVRYVAWDSRLGAAVNNAYYRRWGMRRIAPLAQPRDYGPYRYVTTIPGERAGRYINVFELK